MNSGTGVVKTKGIFKKKLVTEQEHGEFLGSLKRWSVVDKRL